MRPSQRQAQLREQGLTPLLEGPGTNTACNSPSFALWAERIALETMSVRTWCMKDRCRSTADTGYGVAWGRWASVLAILGLWTTNTCGEASGLDPVLARGLAHTQTSKPLVKKAVASTNLLIEGQGMRLVLSDQGVKAQAYAKVDDIPVFLVKVPPTARATTAAVPRGCRCIFVNPDVFNAFIKEQTTGSGRLSLDARYVLTFMLLHEVGHIAKSTAGADFQNGELSELNIEPSRAKADEDEADEFAAGLVKTLMQRKPASTESLEATAVAMALGNLSWNMQAYRSLDKFGALSIGMPSVFFDKNLSHPNLHWRVLRMNHLIHGSRETKELLDTFEDARRRGASPEPLYVEPTK